jgi:hypothetical protein
VAAPMLSCGGRAAALRRGGGLCAAAASAATHRAPTAPAAPRGAAPDSGGAAAAPTPAPWLLPPLLARRRCLHAAATAAGGAAAAHAAAAHADAAAAPAASSAARGRFYLIDAKAQVYRLSHGYGPPAAPAPAAAAPDAPPPPPPGGGQEASLVAHGFVQILISLFGHKPPPTHMAVVVDAPGANFRWAARGARRGVPPGGARRRPPLQAMASGCPLTTPHLASPPRPRRSNLLYPDYKAHRAEAPAGGLTRAGRATGEGRAAVAARRPAPRRNRGAGTPLPPSHASRTPPPHPRPPKQVSSRTWGASWTSLTRLASPSLRCPASRPTT